MVYDTEVVDLNKKMEERYVNPFFPGTFLSLGLRSVSIQLSV